MMTLKSNGYIMCEECNKIVKQEEMSEEYPDIYCKECVKILKRDPKSITKPIVIECKRKECKFHNGEDNVCEKDYVLLDQWGFCDGYQLEPDKIEKFDPKEINVQDDKKGMGEWLK